MLKPSEIIDNISKNCKIIFADQSIAFNRTSINVYKISGSNISKAINNYPNNKSEVNVIKWFSDFWVYIEVKFLDSNIFISISVFEGEEYGNNKVQLFRAEWDNYNSGESSHAQPHWHLMPNTDSEMILQELLTDVESESFLRLLEEEKPTNINLSKIHFAMNGDWADRGAHVHILDDKDKIINWLQGLFSYLRKQLEYVK